METIGNLITPDPRFERHSGSVARQLLDTEVVPHQPALFLAETVGELTGGANFLERLSPQEWRAVRRKGSAITIDAGKNVFLQGDQHNGIWVMEEGIVRTYYTAPSGRQLTLAYWTAGHFVGGPELFGGGEHVWSADVTQDARLLYLPAAAIRGLIETSTLIRALHHRGADC